MIHVIHCVGQGREGDAGMLKIPFKFHDFKTIIRNLTYIVVLDRLENHATISKKILPLDLVLVDESNHRHALRTTIVFVILLNFV